MRAPLPSPSILPFGNNSDEDRGHKGLFTRVPLPTVTEAQVERSRAQETCGIITPLKLQLARQVRMYDKSTNPSLILHHKETSTGQRKRSRQKGTQQRPK